MWTDCLSEFTIWNVVELSSPVEISSMKSALAGPTSISPTGHINSHYCSLIIVVCLINGGRVLFLPVVTRFL
uniref:Uncharacterized protein n=1 Tax=Oryza brachyantha TaxID=4533 RepID=J3L1S3_ORYBR